MRGSSLDGETTDPAAVSQHRDHVGNFVNLLEKMGDENNSETPFPEFPKFLEKLFNLRLIET